MGVSEWVIVVERQFSNISAMSWREQVNFQWDDDEVRFVLDQHAEYDFYIASSLKQQSRVDMSLHTDTLFWFGANQSLLFLLNAAYLAEEQQIPSSLSLVWPNRNSSPGSTATEASTLTITPQIRLICIWYFHYH